MSVQGILEAGNALPDTVIVPGAAMGNITFTADASLVGQPDPVVRVALHSRSGGWSQIVAAHPVKGADQVGNNVKFSAKDVDTVSLSRAGDPSTVSVAYLIY